MGGVIVNWPTAIIIVCPVQCFLYQPWQVEISPTLSAKSLSKSVEKEVHREIGNASLLSSVLGLLWNVFPVDLSREPPLGTGYIFVLYTATAEIPTWCCTVSCINSLTLLGNSLRHVAPLPHFLLGVCWRYHISETAIKGCGGTNVGNCTCQSCLNPCEISSAH